MKYIVKYRDKSVTIGIVTATVEADSEEVAKELIKEGEGDIQDFYEIDNYNHYILSFEDIEECYD